MKIDAAVWPTLSTLLDEYLELPGSARSTWLDSLGPEYDGLLPALRELVGHADARGENFLDTLPKLTINGEACDAPFSPGSIIGPYRLVRELGHGGMSVVWLAERADDSLKRRIALKLPLFSIATASVADRFARERDILAQLAHAHIARLYDAGINSSGQSWLALEYVDGEPITAYCDRERLPVKKRLRLFLDVLRAVQYAHSNLIVHRDLKPSNIFVTRDGGIRLLDFGIAKLLVEGETQETELTRAGGRVLTPEYASPEQFTAAGVGTAADVYSLGVILYELLTGESPYRHRRGRGLALESEILNGTCLKPSQSVGDPAKAEARGTGPKRLAATLKGDLDNIVLRALRRAVPERYPTADAFAQDLERYLAGEPVLARPDAAWYRVRKFVGRNKPAVAAVAMVLLALGTGLSAALWQAARANRSAQDAILQRDRALTAEASLRLERNRALESQRQAEQARNAAVTEQRRAETEAATSRALSSFLQNDLLEQASARGQARPDSKPNPDLKVRDALDRAAARIGGRFDSQPEVEASIRLTMGIAYRDLGLYSQAEQQIKGALDLRRRVLGPEHRDTLTCMSELGNLYVFQDRFSVAESLLTKVAETDRRVLGKDDPDTLAAMNGLAVLADHVQGNHLASADILARVLNVQRRVLGDSHRDTLAVMNNLATEYVYLGRFAEAEQLYSKSVEMKRRTLGADHPSTLAGLNNVAIALRNQGKYAEAESDFKTVLDARRRTLTSEDPAVLESMSSLGLLCVAQGRYSEAGALLTQVLEARRRVLGPQNRFTLASLVNLGDLYRRQANYDLAEPLIREAVDADLRELGATHPNTMNAIASLGRVKLEKGDFAAAEPLLREAVEMYAKSGSDDWRRYFTQSMLGLTLVRLGNYGEAEPFLIRGYEGLQARSQTIPFDSRSILADTAGWLADLYAAWGKTAQAELWRSKASGR